MKADSYRASAYNRRGQALVEWAVFGTAILILWACSLGMARRLLARTAAESWSLLSARQALSNASTALPPGMSIAKRREQRQAVLVARARVRFEGAGSTAAIRLPEGKAVFSFFTWLSSGSLSSAFSE